MEPNDRRTRRTRVFAWIVSIALCPLAPALIGGFFLPIPLGPLVPYVVGLIHAIVLGLPLALLTRRFGDPGGFAATCAGLVIGAVPIGFLIWGSLLPEGVFTQIVMLAALLGAVGGWTFWVLLSWTGGLTPRNEPAAMEPR